VAAPGDQASPDLRRFSRYWPWAEPRIWGPARLQGLDGGMGG
jgi:hypothetical protein